MPTHESAHALFSRKTEYAEINSGFAGHAVRQASAEPISITMNLATGKLQSISFWESYLERFH
ncbi:hypothetical protein H7Q97_18310 [Ochrobactrum sp. CM-21-5]|nr:hypothetical protein [Ochrobactrum sp. CM-21-5]